MSQVPTPGQKPLPWWKRLFRRTPKPEAVIEIPAALPPLQPEVDTPSPYQSTAFHNLVQQVSDLLQATKTEADKPVPPLVAAMEAAADDATVITVLPGEPAKQESVDADIVMHKLRPASEVRPELREILVVIDRLCEESSRTDNTIEPPEYLSLTETGLYKVILSNMSHQVRADLFAKGGAGLVRETILDLVKKFKDS